MHRPDQLLVPADAGSGNRVMFLSEPLPYRGFHQRTFVVNADGKCRVPYQRKALPSGPGRSAVAADPASGNAILAWCHSGQPCAVHATAETAICDRLAERNDARASECDGLQLTAAVIRLVFVRRRGWPVGTAES
jgi:hypothetical protein